VADGIAIRLYSQADFEARPEYTEPEILRTSLASVILQMAALGLGAVEDFPFLDAPDSRQVRSGLQLLTEIGAIEPAGASSARSDDAPDRQRVILALLPYILVVVIIATTKLWTLGINLDKAFKATDLPVKWPGVYGQLLNAKGEASKSAIYNLQTLSNPGTWIFLTAIIVTFIYAARSVPGKFEMSVGKGFAVAVDDSGKVYAWGANEVGQLGKKTDEALVNQAVEVGKLPAAPTALVSGYEHTCALAKGTVWCFGSNRYGQVNGTVSDTPSGLVKVDKIDGATQIGTSGYDTWATVDKGTWTWGNNSWGQADPSQSVVNVAPTLIPASN